MVGVTRNSTKLPQKTKIQGLRRHGCSRGNGSKNTESSKDEQKGRRASEGKKPGVSDKGVPYAL